MSNDHDDTRRQNGPTTETTMQRFSDIAFTPEVEALQRLRGSLDHYRQAAATWGPPDALGEAETAFLGERESIFVSSVGANGWPYVQHRGGRAGFIGILGPSTIGWLERSGNQQFVTAGNLATSDKVAIIAVDHANRQRLKLFGHARFVREPDEELIAALGAPGRAEGAVIVDVVAFDWNCPKYIPQLFDAEQVRAVADPLRARIDQLERQLAELQHAR